jgi:hypothetical protein
LKELEGTTLEKQSLALTLHEQVHRQIKHWEEHVERHTHDLIKKFNHLGHWRLEDLRDSCGHEAGLGRYLEATLDGLHVLCFEAHT